MNPPRLKSKPRWVLHFAIALCALLSASPSIADDHAPQNFSEVTETINRLILDGYQSRGIEPALPCSDTTFARRVYLDLAGRIPLPSEVASWSNEPSEKHREQLVDSLLSSEDHVKHFAELFDTLLMGRVDESQYQKREQNHWNEYLQTVFRQNRPWNEVVDEILLARSRGDDDLGATWFLYERQNDYQKIAESIAPAVFGFRLECAQCHDHMLADEIKQAHYWGLVAFFNRGKNEIKQGRPVVVESAIGGFSEFADLLGGSTPNLLKFLDAEQVDEDRPEKEEKQVDSEDLYLNTGTAEAIRIPKFSRREKFVTDVVQNHPRVSRALVNRVWAILMGRGIVHPHDEMDSTHPPSHPELLDWLSQDFVESGYDLRRLVRGIVTSDAYQLNSIQPPNVKDPASFAWYLERPLTGEQLARSMRIALLATQPEDQSVVGLFRQKFPEVLPADHVTNIKDALFLSNHANVQRLIESSNGPEDLIPKTLALTSPEEQVDSLFETVFMRPAGPDERSTIIAYLNARGEERVQAMQQVVWSMLTSAEFRFNH